MKFSDLVGKTLTSVERTTINGDDVIVFTLDGGKKHRMWHYQDCCEEVHIEDIDGPLDCLIGSPITMADEVSNESEEDGDHDHITWTFYKIGTAKGSVTIRWYGTSNGYYSEAVDFE